MCFMFCIIIDTCMAHIIRYSENMELTLKRGKTPQFYSEAQNEQKYAVVDIYIAKYD